ncbi:MAG TPA: signal peptidase I [Terriglobales bacterium]|nr:signal peptidase I [Terriglobales bacterium]
MPKTTPTPLAETFLRVWIPTLVVALFIITFVVQPFDIPSGSMENTLLIGDHLLADRVRLSPPPNDWTRVLLPYRGLQHGDIVVFLATQNDTAPPINTPPGEHVVKRLIGLPGDHIKLVHGVVYRNGQALVEPYAIHTGGYDPGRDDWPNGGTPLETAPGWQAALPQYLQDGAVVVPPGQYFCMGDNRDNSLDSRYWGFVPEANLIGRPSVIYWSYQSDESDYLAQGMGDRIAGLLSVIIHAPTRTRWSRTLRLPR